MAVLYSTGLVLWILCQIGSRPCFAQCKEPNAFLCDIGVVNMTSDGGAKIRNAIDSQDFMYAVGIEKLIVSSSASGPFLQRIARFTETITYYFYRDPVFQVPAGNTIAEIDIINAANLRAVVAGTNRHLKRLQLENCQLDRMPPTLSQMIELEELIVVRCAMTALRLDVLVTNPKLNILKLSSNQIRQLFPITSLPKQRLSLATIDLSNNQLERLDLSIFDHIPDLERLYVQANRIVRIEATAPVTYASLLRLDVKSNKISSLDTRNLTLPSLTSFYVDDNALTEIPTRWGSLPSLLYLGLDRNNLKQIDMSVFRQLPNLTQIYISENNIQTIRTSSPITLPKLDMLSLENNRIASVNFTGCNFPELTIIVLTNNLLTTVPPLFQRFPKTRMSVEWNPIKCSNILSFKTKIEENRLFVITATTQSECNTQSSIVLDEEIRACCEA
ncbi:leucine-rich repeat-containing G-protein coupled receptor 6-like [Anopheles moucheti]|uniref:leucine-rich repeat-containing G-protein coupled receptor 6-like n=1 Tax=Anopheles moucheti TaxID=186751 RepID=UPI0022F06783|nr:leucine-rich repeat-containing G-protein coupled receptor 6-like [Anopheles moucheti]